MSLRSVRHSFRSGVEGRLIPPAMAGILLLQISAFGMDGALLAVLAALSNILLAILVLLQVRLDHRLMRAVAPAFGLLGLALAWAVLPHGDFFPAMDGVVTASVDLGSQVTRLFGFAAMLMAAAIMGYRHGLARQTLDWIIWAFVANLLLGLVMRAVTPGEIWGLHRPLGGDRFSGTLLNANVAACLFGMASLIALGRALSNGARSTALVRPWLAMAVALATFGACVITGSRTATILLLLGAALLLAGHLRAGRHGAGWALLLPLCGLCLTAILAVAGEMVLQRGAALEYDAGSRLQLWHHLWRISCEAPLFGYGLGAFSEVNLHFLPDPVTAHAYYAINDAHNVGLRLLIEGGWPYLLLVGAGLSTIVSPIVRRGMAPDGIRFRATLVALAFALGCGMVDIALSVPAVGTFCAMLIGLSWGRAIRIGVDGSDYRRKGGVADPLIAVHAGVPPVST